VLRRTACRRARLMLSQFLMLRCTIWIGVCVAYVAAIAWLAETFAGRKQRDSALVYTQAAGG